MWMIRFVRILIVLHKYIYVMHYYLANFTSWIAYVFSHIFQGTDIWIIVIVIIVIVLLIYGIKYLIEN
jgi:hypothetical protein